MADENTPKLSNIFDELWQIYRDLDSTDEASASDNFQSKIKSGIEKAENAVHMINKLSLFSRNEDIQEVATADLRYLLLPGLLGYFTSKSMAEDRLEVIKKTQVYYVDYLRLVKDYGLTKVAIPNVGRESQEKDGEDQEDKVKSGTPNLAAMNNKRQEKIERFKRQKETETRLKDLYSEVNKEHVDDEVQREYYTTLLQRWIDIALEELESIEMELPILEHMSKMKAGSGPTPPQKKEKPKKKFQPFILTRSKLEAQVFGAGYPGIPSMSVEEWYEQSVQEGRFPGPGCSSQGQGHSMQGWAEDPEKAAQDDEDEAAKKEEAEEREDPEALKKARDWDEWTDDHRRGWGNTQNQG